MFKREILFFQISFRLYSAHFCRFIAKAAKDEKWCRQMKVFQSAQTTQLLRRRETEPGGIIRLIQHIQTQSVWPDWAIFCTLGNFSKRVARIIWPNHFWATFMKIWRLFTGHTAHSPRKFSSYSSAQNKNMTENKYRVTGPLTWWWWSASGQRAADDPGLNPTKVYNFVRKINYI